MRRARRNKQIGVKRKDTWVLVSCIVAGPTGSPSAVLTPHAGAGTGLLRQEPMAASPGGLVTLRAPGQGPRICISPKLPGDAQTIF